jgi:hypothetical protein
LVVFLNGINEIYDFFHLFSFLSPSFPIADAGGAITAGHSAGVVAAPATKWGPTRAEGSLATRTRPSAGWRGRRAPWRPCGGAALTTRLATRADKCWTAWSAGSVATPRRRCPRETPRDLRCQVRDDAAGGLRRTLPCKPRDWRRLTSLLFPDSNSRCSDVTAASRRSSCAVLQEQRHPEHPDLHLELELDVEQMRC